MLMLSPSPSPRGSHNHKNSMILKKTIEVSVQIKDKGSKKWEDQKRFDIKESLREGTNASNRWTTGIASREGHFRFVIKVKDDFEWGNANALKVLLWFDEGWDVKAYPVFLLHPNKNIARLNRNQGMRSMRQTCDGLEYRLQYIVLPLEIFANSRSEQWFKAMFKFDKIPVNGLSGRRSSYTPLQCARLRIDIQPCELIFRANSRSIRLVSYHEGDRDSSRVQALENGLTLETAIDYGDIEPCDKPQQHSEKSIGYDIFSFIFYYRQIGHVETTEDVDIIDCSKSTLSRQSPISRSRSTPDLSSLKRDPMNRTEHQLTSHDDWSREPLASAFSTLLQDREDTIVVESDFQHPSAPSVPFYEQRASPTDPPKQARERESLLLRAQLTSQQAQKRIVRGTQLIRDLLRERQDNEAAAFARLGAIERDARSVDEDIKDTIGGIRQLEGRIGEDEAKLNRQRANLDRYEKRRADLRLEKEDIIREMDLLDQEDLGLPDEVLEELNAWEARVHECYNREAQKRRHPEVSQSSSPSSRQGRQKQIKPK